MHSFIRYALIECLLCAGLCWWKASKQGVLVEDEDIEGHWTHQFPWTHWIYSYIQNNFLWGGGKKTSKTSPATLTLLVNEKKKNPHSCRSERLRSNLTSAHPPPTAWWQLEGTHHPELSPEEQWVWKPHVALQLWRLYPEEWAPRTPSFESPQRLHPQDPRGYREHRKGS